MTEEILDSISDEIAERLAEDLEDNFAKIADDVIDEHAYNLSLEEMTELNAEVNFKVAKILQ